MTSIMRAQHHRPEIPKYLWGASIASKTGNFEPFIASDIGIVTPYSGSPVVMCFLNQRHRGARALPEDCMARMSELVLMAAEAERMIRSLTDARSIGLDVATSRGGLEISGHVAAVRPRVEGVKAGERVAAFLEDAGGFADQCVVPVERLISIPQEMGLGVAAAFPVQALPSWLSCIASARPGPAT